MNQEVNNHINENVPIDETEQKSVISLEPIIQSEEISILQNVPVESDDRQHINLFAAKKTVAQGMMDMALLTANANQLRYLMELNYKTKNFRMLYGMIITSLVLQVGVGCSLIFRGRKLLNDGEKDKLTKRVNNAVTFAIFLVTVLNIFIAAFTVTSPTT